MMELTFGRKLLAAFLVAGLVLVAVATFGYRSTRTLIDNEERVSHSQEVRRELTTFLAELTEAESSQRGYVISGDEGHIGPHQTAVAQAQASLENVRRLTADNAAQQESLRLLEKPLGEKLAYLERSIDARRGKPGPEDAIALSRSGTGKRTMDEIRKILGAMDGREAALLEQRHREATATAQRALDVILWGSIFGAVVVALVGTWTSSSLTRQVGSAVRHIQSSSAELQAAANQQASGARESATAMSEISTTISELMASSRQIADSAQRVAQIAEMTAAAAKTGDFTVERGRESVASIRAQVDLIVGHMLELGKKSQQIGAVLDIVSELAEQTNILAINATIEAAGAGESGKRFAVVADEIRKLADRVTGSTKEIRVLIDDVRGAVNTTVMTTETGSKAVEAGSRGFNDVATAFKQITQQVLTASEAAREIGLSTKQQASAVEQVNIAITNVAQSTRETEVSTGQTLQTAAELSSLSRDLLRIIQSQQAQLAASSRQLSA